MARGMVNGEAIVSQASTDEYRDGYERTFGDRKPVRGRFVYDASQGKCVPIEEYQPPPAKCGTTVMVDRWLEGTVAPDGTDIGSRAKRNAWMKANDVAPYDDFKGAREKRAKEQEARARGEIKSDPKLREMLGRELYKHKVII